MKAVFEIAGKIVHECQLPEPLHPSEMFRLNRPLDTLALAEEFGDAHMLESMGITSDPMMFAGRIVDDVLKFDLVGFRGDVAVYSRDAR